MTRRRREEDARDRRVEEAIHALRRLDDEARRGWSVRYDAERVRIEAGEAVAILAQSVDAAPEAYRELLARGYVKEIGP